MGFTHVEFLPVMEHPFYGSWGYQTTGYFAPTSRYGTPQDFMYLIDYLHQHGIGVILDWVPSHFPTDEHGLGYFDGTHLYEHADPRQGFHPDWNSYIFNYGRNEVRSFLHQQRAVLARQYHIDGLRVDAVASMLYLDYSRKAGRVDPEPATAAARTSRRSTSCAASTSEVYSSYPDAQTIAEESTRGRWCRGRPTSAGSASASSGTWAGCTTRSSTCQHDPVHRKYHHNELTFRMLYAFTENFVLPLSHDEVVHGKGSLLGKMPGDDWQKFANLRLLFGYMYAQPGKKLLFMGGEFGQWREWNHDTQPRLAPARNSRCTRAAAPWVRRPEPPLSAPSRRCTSSTATPAGFEWIDRQRQRPSVLASCASARRPGRWSCVCNFTPVPRPQLPRRRAPRRLLARDAQQGRRAYGGSG